MTMPTFTTAKKDRAPSSFDLDGFTLTARRPKSAAVVNIAMVMQEHEDDAVKQMIAVVNFLDRCLDPPSRQHIHDRLLDPDDDFDSEDMMPIIEWITEKYGSTTGEERPTTPSSASRGRRRTTGRALTDGAPSGA